MVAVGRGEEAPLVGSDKRRPTRAERAKNRRTELVIESLEAGGADAGQDAAPEAEAATSLTAAKEADGDSPSGIADVQTPGR